uniref:Uncharacterized protein n=1 Tax=Trichobilharzia regenti TaxID=157069 RepID=A0AA85IW44_TRIRE|nr:unnamed protein product [Trichobilharzia regenti]
MMTSKIWLTLISSIALYVMCLPPTESAFLIGLFCWFYPGEYICGFYHNPEEAVKNLYLESKNISLPKT